MRPESSSAADLIGGNRFGLLRCDEGCAHYMRIMRADLGVGHTTIIPDFQHEILAFTKVLKIISAANP